MIITILALGFGTAVSAQKVAVGFHGRFGGGGYYRPRTTVVVGTHVPVYHHYYRLTYYRPWYYHGWYRPFFYYDPFFAGYYAPPYGNYYRPSNLDTEIADIKHNYDEKIESSRHDKSLTGKERRQEIRELKQEREDAIADAEKNYYKQ